MNTWQKSSHCHHNGCVELASGILVRDSKNPDGPKLRISRDVLRHLKDAA